MKKLIILALLILLIGCGTANQDEDIPMTSKATSAEIEQDEENTSDETEEESEENEATEEDEVVIPTERTVDTKNHYPWQYYFTSKMVELQEQGEIVFLWSDAEKLEDDIILGAYMDTEGIDEFVEIKEENMIGFANIIDLFIKDVEQYIDNKEYFDKLREAQEYMRNLDYETVVTLIEEAKQIRESE